MDKLPNRGAGVTAKRAALVMPPMPGEVPDSILRPFDGLRVRVPTLKPLSRQQLAVAALLSDGWGIQAIGEMMGVSWQTISYHASEAADRIPGDLPRKGRVVIWYRGAPLSILMRPGSMDAADVPEPMQRREAIKRALVIVEGRGCPCCGYDGVIQADDSAHNMTAGAEKALSDELRGKL